MHIDATPPALLGRALPLVAKSFAAAQLHALDGISPNIHTSVSFENSIQYFLFALLMAIDDDLSRWKDLIG